MTALGEGVCSYRSGENFGVLGRAMGASLFNEKKAVVTYVMQLCNRYTRHKLESLARFVVVWMVVLTLGVGQLGGGSLKFLPFFFERCTKMNNEGVLCELSTSRQSSK